MENMKKIGFGAGILTCIVSLMVIIGSTGYTPQSEQRWQTVQILSALGAENNPGSGASGFLEIFFINHSTAPENAYLQNTSATLESWCVANMAGKTPYGSADEFHVELASEVSFDIVVRVRFNRTHAYETDHFVDNP